MSFPALNTLVKAIRIVLNGAGGPTGPTDEIIYIRMDNVDIDVANMDNIVDIIHPAIMINTPTTGVTGQINQGVNFVSTSSEHMTMQRLGNYSAANITVKIWFRITTSVLGSLVAFSTSISGDLFGWDLFSLANGKISFRYFTGVGSTSVSAESLSAFDDGNWHMAAGTYNGLSLRLYIDDLAPVITTSVTPIAYSASPNMRIGARFISGTTNFHNGDLDEYKYFDNAKSGEEILELYIDDGGIQKHIVNINPNKIIELIRPSAPYYSPLIKATVFNGTGPFTYSWVYKTGDNVLSIIGPTNLDTIQVQGQAFTTETNDTFEVTVTDTGNDNVTATATINFFISWDAV